MQARYVFCVVSVLWLQASAAPAKENEGLETAISSAAAADDNQKVLDKRSAGNQPVFGANNFRDRPMVDWNMIYNSKRGVKRPSLGQPSQGRFDMLGDNMVNWEKVFSKRKWMANEDSQGFGADRPLSNADLVNWSKLFAKRADDKRAFGSVDNGLGSDGELSKADLQKWSSFVRHARTNQ